MHELSIAHSIISLADNALSEKCKGVVTRVDLEVGELSGIEIESLEMAFSVIKTDTFLENAKLNIQVIKGKAACAKCKTIFPLHAYGKCCPECNSYSIKVVRGTELRLLDIVVDE
jgi:hydrogenase nickel incorporation protein HypA/HybF